MPHYYSKVMFFGIFIQDNTCLHFSLLMFHDNIVNVSENLNKMILLKSCLRVTYPTNFCVICSQFYYGKTEHNRIFEIE